MLVIIIIIVLISPGGKGKIPNMYIVISNKATVNVAALSAVCAICKNMLSVFYM